MDNGVLRKRLNTYKSGKSGQLRNVGDDVVMEVLRAMNPDLEDLANTL